jgi:hypothetical protein
MVVMAIFSIWLILWLTSVRFSSGCNAIYLYFAPPARLTAHKQDNTLTQPLGAPIGASDPANASSHHSGFKFSIGYSRVAAPWHSADGPGYIVWRHQTAATAPAQRATMSACHQRRAAARELLTPPSGKSSCRGG